MAQEITWKEDNAKMVLIPAGSFEMGDHLDDMENALPVHTVELDALELDACYMDINEVTVGQFKKFVQESKYSYDRWNNVVVFSPTDEHPMIFVSYGMMQLPIVNGRANGYPLKRSGNMQPVVD